ncbi:MAG TPA: HAD-IIA family hydrolase [Acidimicrobiales bacterium]|nr:HAD-IIA family hydrolase [Acidimicrobiales bacterium]
MLDLDGVVWLSDRPIPGSPEAVRRLREHGERVVVVTNNSSLTVAQYLDKLQRLGVPTAAEDLITSAQVAAGLVAGGSRALVVGGDGIHEALRQRGVEVVDGADAAPETVVVGWTRAFDYAVLTAAMRAVRAGARLLGTNHDPTYPTPDGLLPGGGTLTTAIAYASGVAAEFAGKPNQATVDAARERFGDIAIMVGDQPSTDGVLARRLGATWALVLTGVTRKSDLPVEPEPDIVSDSLAELVASHLDA